jgi:hypothetical protein
MPKKKAKKDKVVPEQEVPEQEVPEQEVPEQEVAEQEVPNQEVPESQNVNDADGSGGSSEQSEPEVKKGLEPRADKPICPSKGCSYMEKQVKDRSGWRWRCPVCAKIWVDLKGKYE